jgi:hypothetical protein
MSHNIDLVREKQLKFKSIAPPLFSTWRHYKGEVYLVNGFVMRESTEEMEICYLKVGESLTYSWCRPLSEWEELVEHNGGLVKRFVKSE